MACAKPARSADRLAYSASIRYNPSAAPASNTHHGAERLAATTVANSTEPGATSLPGRRNQRIRRRPGRSKENPAILSPITF